MANVDSPFGLRPIRMKDGSPYNGSAVPMYIASGYGTALFIGDPVIKVAGGSNTAAVTLPGVGSFGIGTMPNVQKALAGSTDLIAGVIVGFAASPTSGLENQYNPASTERIAYVCNNPDVIFEVQADGAVAAASMGLNGNLIFTHSGSTASGLSGVELDTTSESPAADATFQLVILQAANRDDNDTTLTHAKVEVLIALHMYAHGVTTTGSGILGI